MSSRKGPRQATTEPQSLILLPDPAVGAHRNVPLRPGVQTMSPCLPSLDSKMVSPGEAPRSVHQLVIHPQPGFFMASHKACIWSNIQSLHTHSQSTLITLGSRPRSLQGLRPQSTPALRAPGSTRPLPYTFNHSLHACLPIILQVCVQAQAWKRGSSRWPGPIDSRDSLVWRLRKRC